MKKAGSANTPEPFSVDQPSSQRASDTHNAEPPPYTSYGLPAGNGSNSDDQHFIPGLPPLDFSSYRLGDSSISDDRSTVTTWSPQLTSSLSAFLKLLQKQAALPPKPEIHIVGHHKGPGGKIEEDFNIRLDMMQYLVPRNPDLLMGYLEVQDGSQLDLNSTAATERLCREAGAFWNANQRAKSFTINRTIKHWDTEYIEGRLRSLLSELRYRGETTITFPTVYSSVIVRPQKSFVDILSLFSTTMKFGVDVVWPFANVVRQQASSGTPRTCNVCDEQVWWRTWKHTIGEAIISKTHGWVGTDAWAEVTMGCRPRSKKPAPWGMDV